MNWRIQTVIITFLLVFFIGNKHTHGNASNTNRGTMPRAQTAVIENEEFAAVFTTRGAALQSLTMKNPRYVETPRNWVTGQRDKLSKTRLPVDLVTTNVRDFELYAPLVFKTLDRDGIDFQPWNFEIQKATKNRVDFRYKQKGVPIVIYKKFELDKVKKQYQIWLTIRVENIGRKDFRFRGVISGHGYQHKTEADGSLFSKPPNLLRGICRYEDVTKNLPWNDKDWNHPFLAKHNIRFVGVQTDYFLSAMIPADDIPVSCSVSKSLDAPKRYPSHDSQPWGHVTAELRFAEVVLRPGESKVFRVKNYFGPKRYQLLRSAGHGLDTSVDFGILRPICQVLLRLLIIFQSFVVNWGLAIILLTIALKTALMPLAHRSLKASERIKTLKPELDRINEKFKNDAQGKQQATMALYKKHKVNPLAGCLPTLAQMPIWVALYTTLRTSPELHRAPLWGWITDLSSSDPYFITPIIMGGLLFIQQRFTPAMGDTTQQRILKYVMPIMFTGLMLFWPSGLALYAIVNSLLSIAHLAFVRRRFIDDEDSTTPSE
ncbi:MAG: membrane protein insertase YidC [Proteobacteria bacterium]|nr:membrane protein insertase YidC [Pseudomonadota bacterium]